jgi:hypothetical protein
MVHGRLFFTEKTARTRDLSSSGEPFFLNDGIPHCKYDLFEG